MNHHPLVSAFICWAQLVFVLTDACPPPLLTLHPRQAVLTYLHCPCYLHASDSYLDHLASYHRTSINTLGTDMMNEENMAITPRTEHGNQNISHTSSDLIMLINRYCDRMMHENIKEEREHTNNKIKIVIKELSEISKHVSKQDSKIEDMSLKIDTMFSYQEQLVFNLKAGLQDTLASVHEDIEHIQTKLEAVEKQITTSCTICGKTFSQPEAYHAHQCSQHSKLQQNMFACHICSKVQPNLCDLVIHLREVHDKKTAVTCDICSNLFETSSDLATHKTLYHPISQDAPDYSGCSMVLSSTHMSSDYLADGYSGDYLDQASQQLSSNQVLSSSSPSCLSPINQLDGIEDLSVLNGDSSSTFNNSTQAECHARVWVAPYLLDQNKQVSKLAEDANNEDFEIVVSPNEHNVNILCSTGFYSIVVTPAFSTFSTNFSALVAGVNITCYDITKKKDGTDASVYTVYFFRLGTNSKNSIAKVVIHLHHTARKVQIQGGALVDDKKRASMWFVENFLVPAFSEAAKSKAKDIKHFNTAVKDVVAKHVKKISAEQ